MRTNQEVQLVCQRAGLPSTGTRTGEWANRNLCSQQGHPAPRQMELPAAGQARKWGNGARESVTEKQCVC